MGLADNLQEDFKTRARQIAKGEAADPARRDALKAARRAAGIMSGQLAETQTLFDHEVDVTADWLVDSVVLVFQDEALLVLRFEGSGEAKGIHPIGECRRCKATVPLGPSVNEPIDFGRVLIAGTPIGHECPGAP